ncbi:MAG: hypothetical protein GYA39_07610 [Methanothrix sp.]|nr:hypothetical protein [Methanothrix sp.]
MAAEQPASETIILVQDDLNAHTAGSFYEALPSDNAFKLAKRFEYHYTPKNESRTQITE